MPQVFASAGMVTVIVLCITASGGKFFGGERDAAEHLTGVFRATGIVAALLDRDAVIQHWHHQLGFPLQPDDGELS